MQAPVLRLSSTFTLLRCIKQQYRQPTCNLYRQFASRYSTINPVFPKGKMSTLPHQTDASQHAVGLDKTAVTAASDASGKPHEAQADISKMKVAADGSFKRKASTFRDWIKDGGEFVPEKGV